MSDKNNIHKARLKSIRPFVAFDYDLRRKLTPYQKRKIKSYFDVVNELTARPTLLYRDTDKSRLKRVQQFAQHDTTLTQINVAFIPNTDRTANIQIDSGGNIVLSGRYVSTQTVPLDALSLATNPQRHTAQMIRQHAPDAQRFTVQAGRYAIAVALTQDTVPGYIATLTEKYNVDDGHHYDSWLFALNAHSYTNQSSFDDYDREKRATKARLKTKRKKAMRSKTSGRTVGALTTAIVNKKAVKKKAVK